MIPETENPQEAKNVYPGNPARHAYADQGRYFTQTPQTVDFLAGRLIYQDIRKKSVLLYQPFVTFSDTSATDDVRNHCDKRRNGS